MGNIEPHILTTCDNCHGSCTVKTAHKLVINLGNYVAFTDEFKIEMDLRWNCDYNHSFLWDHKMSTRCHVLLWILNHHQIYCRHQAVTTDSIFLPSSPPGCSRIWRSALKASLVWCSMTCWRSLTWRAVRVKWCSCWISFPPPKPGARWRSGFWS